MKNSRLVRGLIAFVMAFTLCVYAFSPAASAITSKNGSITLNVFDANTEVPIEGASFRLYFFAAAYEKPGGVGYDYVIPYDDCNMDMGNLQDSHLPVHLTHFALTHDLPFTIKSSDKNGTIVYGDLAPGIYLIVPSGNIPEYFMPSPFVINIPLYDEDNKNWIYDINATPKMRIYMSSGTEDTTYISVKKLWDSETEHPDSVTVSLLCDYREAEQVVLNESNNWYYRWDNLSKRHSWSVVESSVPDGYTVSYETSSNTVTIINTGDKTTTDPSEPTTNPVSTTKPVTEPTTKPDELIHTGQLNWPVPYLAVAGLLLFSIGWAMLNLGKKEEI